MLFNEETQVMSLWWPKKKVEKLKINDIGNTPL